MATPVLFLDSASRYREAVDQPKAQTAAKVLLDTLRNIKKFNRRLAINTDVPLGQFQIAENWTLQAVLGGHAFREEWEFIRTISNRSPLSAELEAFLNNVNGSECCTRPSGIPSMALAWATVLESGIVSFKAHSDWLNSWVEMDITSLADDETITRTEGRVRNASDPAHAGEHSEWLSALGFAEVPSGEQLWAERAERFPNLRLLSRVEKDLLALYGSGAPYQQALSLLTALSMDAKNWREGHLHPTFSMKVTPEHEMRRKLCWWHDEVTGKNELFDSHARFTGSFAGRLHLRLDVPARSIVIAYVGGKLRD